MYDDDSRGLESPDRPNAPPSTDARVVPDDGERPCGSRSSSQVYCDGGSSAPTDPDEVCRRLEVIDHQVRKLLETGADRPDLSREGVRHLREIRAEVEWARRLLCPPLSTDYQPAVPTTADGISMVVERGPLVTTVLGPDPVAYERRFGRDGLECEDAEREDAERDDSEHEQERPDDSEREQDRPDDEACDDRDEERTDDSSDEADPTDSTEADESDGEDDRDRDDRNGGDRDAS